MALTLIRNIQTVSEVRSLGLDPKRSLSEPQRKILDNYRLRWTGIGHGLNWEILGVAKRPDQADPFWARYDSEEYEQIIQTVNYYAAFWRLLAAFEAEYEAALERIGVRAEPTLFDKFGHLVTGDLHFKINAILGQQSSGARKYVPKKKRDGDDPEKGDYDPGPKKDEGRRRAELFRYLSGHKPRYRDPSPDEWQARIRNTTLPSAIAIFTAFENRERDPKARRAYGEFLPRYKEHRQAEETDGTPVVWKNGEMFVREKNKLIPVVLQARADKAGYYLVKKRKRS